MGDWDDPPRADLVDDDTLARVFALRVAVDVVTAMGKTTSTELAEVLALASWIDAGFEEEEEVEEE